MVDRTSGATVWVVGIGTLPAFSRLDSLRYTIPLHYREAQLTLIGEVFNAANTTNIVNAGGAIVGTAGFPRPTATLRPREFQLGARRSF